MGKTSIEWTDQSWPVINGCRRLSEGCRHCYAERLTATRLSKTPKYQGLAVFGQNGPRWTAETRLWEKHLDMPLRLKKPSKIFVCDMGDLFYEGVPFEWIDRVWATMLLAPRHTFQVLTKRPKRMREYLSDAGLYDRVLRAADVIRGTRPGLGQVGVSDPSKFPAKWIWLGASVEDQPTIDERVQELIDTPAAVRFVSYEPALGPGDFSRWLMSPGERKRRQDAAYWAFSRQANAKPPSMADPAAYAPGIDQIIMGGESGPGARPMRADWVTAVRDQCQAAGTAFFFKQWGEHVEVIGYQPDRRGRVRFDGESRRLVEVDGHQFVRMGKGDAGRMIGGATYSEFPR